MQKLFSRPEDKIGSIRWVSTNSENVFYQLLGTQFGL